MGLVAGVQDNLIDAVLLFVFLKDEGVVVTHSNFILLGAVSIPAGINTGMDQETCVSVSNPTGHNEKLRRKITSSGLGHNSSSGA